MIVDKSSLAYIQNVVHVAATFKISNLIIEPNRVRAMEESQCVIILHSDNVPVLPFGSIGLNRLDVFSSRFAMAQGLDQFAVEATVEDRDPDNVFARAITMKAKGIKIDYRCANPMTIKAPKMLNETFNWRVQLTSEAVHLIQQAQKAMDTDDISFIADEKGMSFELADINNDKLTYKFADYVDVLESGDGSPAVFVHKYPIKYITTLFKANPDGFFVFGARGTLKGVVKNLDVYVIAIKK